MANNTCTFNVQLSQLLEICLVLDKTRKLERDFLSYLLNLYLRWSLHGDWNGIRDILDLRGARYRNGECRRVTVDGRWVR